MNLNLKDRVVMITGSTGGVGEALVKAFAAEGCKPEEVADLALFLASEKSSHITGSLVTMDGGQAALGR